MSEIDYTNNDGAIEVEITRQMRGLDVEVPSGDVGVVTPCPPDRFRNNPDPAPDEPAHMLTGRYQNTRNGQCTCTAQINQAGKYIFGWFQVDFPAEIEDEPSGDRYREILPAVTGTFAGEMSGSNFPVQVAITSPGSRIFTGRFECTDTGNDLEHNNVVRLYFDTGGEVSFERRREGGGIYSIGFQWAELGRIAPDPRLPDAALATIRRTQAALYQAEAHPLRRDQIESMRTFLDHYVKPVLREGLASSPMERLGGVHNFFRLFRRIFTHNRMLGTASGCPYHDIRDNLDRRFRCSCGLLFREEQEELVKLMLLNILETETIEINRSPMPLLEAIYQLYQDSTGDSTGPFREFRELWGSTGGQPVLPEHLDRYKYSFRIRYEQRSAGIPNTGIGLGGRSLRMRITRFVRNDSGGWTRQAQSGEMPGRLALIKVELSKESGESPIPVTREIGVDSFDIETYRNWRWQDFPGIWEIFKAYATVRIPFNYYSHDLYSNAAVIFHGSGQLPPIVAQLENASGSSIDSDHRFAAQAGFVWMPGYLWGGIQARDQRTIDPRDLPEASVRWERHTFEGFPVDVERVSEQGRGRLGMLLAENLMLFLNRSSHLRIDGHTSRTASWYHNNVLSIRRAQFALQTVVDILGPQLNLPLAGDESQEGNGSVRIFGHGERAAMERGTADRVDVADDRRVNIALDGRAVARMRDG